MPGLDLDAIKARCAAATPGPWAVRQRHYRDGMDLTARWVDLGPRRGAGRFDAAANAPSGTAWGSNHADADTEFVAHAREDVPALVAEVERLRAALRHYADDANWSHGEWMGPGSCGELACRTLGLPTGYGVIEPARLKRLLGEAPPLLPWETPHPERNTADDPRAQPVDLTLRGTFDVGGG